MGMYEPPHPGGIVKRQCLEPLGLSVTRAAKGPGVTRQALSELVNEHTGISVEIATRLSKTFGSTPEAWLGMQMAYDLWQARKRAGQIAVERFAAAYASVAKKVPVERNAMLPDFDVGKPCRERR